MITIPSLFDRKNSIFIEVTKNNNNTNKSTYFYYYEHQFKKINDNNGKRTNYNNIVEVVETTYVHPSLTHYQKLYCI